MNFIKKADLIKKLLHQCIIDQIQFIRTIRLYLTNNFIENRQNLIKKAQFFSKIGQF